MKRVNIEHIDELTPEIESLFKKEDLITDKALVQK